MRDFELKSARFIASDCLKRFLRPGDRAVDATMGNGHDTQLLCELVGEAGCVCGFDIQPQAVENTAQRLETAGLRSRARLFCIGHEHMAEYVHAPVDAVVFNLGWLPGGAHEITTRWEITRSAVEQALRLLKEEGICIICAYPGHPEGENEKRSLTQMLGALKPQDFNVLHHRFLNAGASAPECFILQKQPGARYE